MKRSEMLTIIANQLRFLDGRFFGYIEEASKEELAQADVILTTLEAAGMQPPVAGFMIDWDGWNPDKNEWYPTKVKVHCQKWEPEDEEK